MSLVFCLYLSAILRQNMQFLGEVIYETKRETDGTNLSDAVHCCPAALQNVSKRAGKRSD